MRNPIPRITSARRRCTAGKVADETTTTLTIAKKFAKRSLFSPRFVHYLSVYENSKYFRSKIGGNLLFRFSRERLVFFYIRNNSFGARERIQRVYLRDSRFPESSELSSTLEEALSRMATCNSLFFLPNILAASCSSYTRVSRVEQRGIFLRRLHRMRVTVHEASLRFYGCVMDPLASPEIRTEVPISLLLRHSLRFYTHALLRWQKLWLSRIGVIEHMISFLHWYFNYI